MRVEFSGQVSVNLNSKSHVSCPCMGICFLFILFLLLISSIEAYLLVLFVCGSKGREFLRHTPRCGSGYSKRRNCLRGTLIQNAML